MQSRRRFMESALFLLDLLRGHEPESAGKPDALQTLRAAWTGCRSREAFGVRGFTPAFRPRFMESGLVLSDLRDGHEPKVPRTWPSAPRFMEESAPRQRGRAGWLAAGRGCGILAR